MDYIAAQIVAELSEIDRIIRPMLGNTIEVSIVRKIEIKAREQLPKYDLHGGLPPPPYM
jgi:hypothetical protein